MNHSASILMHLWVNVPVVAENMEGALKQAQELVQKNPKDLLKKASDFNDWKIKLVGINDDSPMEGL